MTAQIVFLTRFVPHYRVPLLRRLHAEFGWVVATSAETGAQGLKLATEDEPFIRRFPFRFPRPGDPFTTIVPVGQILKETGASAIVSEFGLRMSSTYGLLARRRLGGVPVMFWTHGFNSSRGEISMKDKALQGTARLLLRQADGCVCYSEPGLERLARVMPRDRLFVAHNTMDLAPLQASAARLGRLEVPGGPHLLSVGRMLADKDFPLLIRAFRRFRAQCAPDATLTLVGDGPDMPAVRAAAGDGVGIRLLGSIYDEEILAREFMSADLFVYAGAVGLAANHALAFGLPVMIFEQTPQGPLHSPEDVYVVPGVSGVRVKPYTQEGLVAAMAEFFTRHPNPRAAFGAKIAEFVEENLSLDRMVRDFSAVTTFLNGRV